MSIIGHKNQIQFLKKSVEKNAFSQAYIFSGPERLGKFLIAKNFAKNIVFEENDFSAGVDEKIKNSSNFIFLEPEMEKKKGVTKIKDIKIDDVREAQKKLSTFPSFGKFNVLIVRDAHKMNQNSQNALLKTLEEPNSSSIVILVTHDENAILPTIKSRCQIVRFGLVSLAEIESGLKEIGQKNSNELSVFSMGRPGLAVELVRDSEKFLEMKTEYQNFRKIFSSDISEKIDWAQEASKNVSETIGRLECWIWFLRIQGYRSLNDQEKLRTIYFVISKIQDVLKKLERKGSNSRLILENLLINIQA